MTHPNHLPRSTPEAHGIASADILAFLAALAQHNPHSVMLVRHGHVVAEGWWSPYAPEHPHMLFSLSKSFTATAVGMLVDAGRLALDAPVVAFFPADSPTEISDHWTALQVQHLLSMTTGHAADTLSPGFARETHHWVKTFFAQPLEYPPGSHFVYNSGATYLLSAIVQQITGTTMLDYLQPRLLAPLGITNATWETCPRGINTGGWGLSITTEAIARFGQLYLQGGMWRGQQLVSAAWVAAASTAHIASGDDPASDWAQGYGFQFWRCRHGAYRGDGAFGQFCLIMLEQDAVLAITSGVEQMQAVLNVVWEHLLPAFQSAALPANPTAHEQLQHTLQNLQISPIQRQNTAPLAEQISGKTYNFSANFIHVTTMVFDFGADGCVLSVSDYRGEHQIACGNGEWRASITTMYLGEPQPIVASATWTDEHTFVIEVCFYHTPFYTTITNRFNGDTLVSEYCMNVGFGSTELPPLEGTLD